MPPTSPFNPPLNVPATIVMEVITGGFGSSVGGGLPQIQGNMVAQIIGDTNGVFSILNLETDALVHDPDVPKGSRTWETVDSIDGAGPIAIGRNEALLVTVGFGPPISSTKESYSATAIIVADGTSGPALFQVPIQATVDFRQLITIEALACPLLDNGISPGKTEDLQVVLKSTVQHGVTGVFSLSPGNPIFSSPTVSVSVPAKTASEQTGDVIVILPVTCATGTAAGVVLDVPFQFVSSDPAGNSRIALDIQVLAGRVVTITSDLSPNELLAPVSSTPCKVTVNDSGGLSEIAFSLGPLPPGVAFNMGPLQTIFSGPLPDDPRVSQMDVTIGLSAPVAPGNLPAVALNWVVPAADNHPEITGTFTFNIRVGVAAPAAGLGSNSNYFLFSPGAFGVCNNLIGLSVAIHVDADIVASNGFGFQLNAYSPAKELVGWQQYLIYLSPTAQPPQLTCMVDNWPLKGANLINTQPELATLPARDLPAGYTLTISLQNDTAGNITGATYVVVDNLQKTVATKTIVLLSVPGVTAVDLSPIIAFQFNIVSFLNSTSTVLSSGAGTITYTATSPLTVLNSEPACAESGFITAETANTVYGLLPSGASNTLTQTFGESTAAAMIVKKGKVRPSSPRRP
jgi:hypothetical protein